MIALEVAASVGVVSAVRQCIKVSLALRKPKSSLPETRTYTVDPDDPRVVVGGPWGTSVLTGEIGYDRFKCESNELAADLVAWLNNSSDHRSFASVCFDRDAARMAARQAAQAAERSQRPIYSRKADLYYRKTMWQVNNRIAESYRIPDCLCR